MFRPYQIRKKTKVNAFKNPMMQKEIKTLNILDWFTHKKIFDQYLQIILLSSRGENWFYPVDLNF